LVLLVAGCGSKGASVSGTVAFTDGKPVKNGSLTFHPDSGKGNKHKNPVVGVIDAEGKYALSAGKEGVPLGWYKVTVVSTVPSDPKNEYSLPKDLLPVKYKEVGTTDIAIEVKVGGSYDIKIAP